MIEAIYQPAIDASIAYADQYIDRACELGWADAANAMNKQVNLFKYDLELIDPALAIVDFQRTVDMAHLAMNIELGIEVTL